MSAFISNVPQEKKKNYKFKINSYHTKQHYKILIHTADKKIDNLFMEAFEFQL